MTEAIAVGFTPTTSSGFTLGAGSAAAAPAGEGGLFAALLAMLAPGTGAIDLPASIQTGLPQTSQALQTRVDALVAQLGTDLGELGDLGAALKKLADNGNAQAALVSDTSGAVAAATAPPAPTEATLTSALTRLTKAITAVSDAIDACGQPDEAHKAELDAAADEVLALLGFIPTEAAPPADRLSALVEQIRALGAPSQAANTPTPNDAGDVAPAIAGVASTSPDAKPTEGATSPAGAPSSQPQTDLSETPTEPVATRLARLLAETADAVRPSSPELADKLTRLAQSLPTLPDDILAALDLAADGGDATPELVALVDAAARGTPRTQTSGPATIASPQLPLPAQPLPADTDPSADATQPQPAAPATPAASNVELAADKPAPAVRLERAEPTRAAPAGRPDAQPDPAQTAQTATDDGQPNAVASGQPTATAPPVAQAAAIRAAQTAYQPAVAQVVIPQVAFEVVRQFEAGNSRFQIRLDPPELGRIDVRLDVDKAGNVTARMAVERPETLDLMQRDQRALQQALQQAGLDANRTNLEFSLRQNPFAGEGFAGDDRRGRSPLGGEADIGASEIAPESTPQLYRGAAASSALNLVV